MVVRPNGPSLGQAEIETATDQPFTYLSDYTKKKIRNLEKRKTKLESYKNKLKSGEKLTPDQYEAVKKFDEVLGMITFANEIIAHMNQMGVAVDKEKAKRLQAEQSQTESDKLECLTRQIELYTLMHLTKDELVGTLREECSFLPSPGASLHQFASGTAKHLINLTDPKDKVDPINYQNVIEKLEEIEPSFNPVPEYEYEDEEEEDDEDELVEVEQPEEEIELVEVVPETVDEEKLEEVEEEVAEVNAGGDGTSPIEQVENNADESYEIDVVNDTDQYQNHHVAEEPKEEEQIKEILTEVTSQFNFMAPAAMDDEEEFSDADEPIIEEHVPIVENGTAQHHQQEPPQLIEALQQENIAPQKQAPLVPPTPPISTQPQVQIQATPPQPAPGFGYNNGFNGDHHPHQVIDKPEEAIKDELNWQQKATQQQKKQPSGSYKNSQRYQRQFNGNNRQANGDSQSRGRYIGSRGYRRGGGGGSKPE